ncbi:F-box protein At3g54460 [Linum grandiflorum]
MCPSSQHSVPSSTMEQEQDPFPGLKLCGYLCAVLSTPSLASSSLPFLSPCRPFSDGHRVGFLTEQDNVFLSPIPADSTLDPQETVAAVAENTGISFGKRSGSSLRKRKSIAKTGGCLSRSESRTKRKVVRGIGMVNGSLSVVHQIHSLVTHKCVEADARVLQVQVRESDGDVRVVVLVDVYLPTLLWSGWQFPRSGPVAGALFRHLSCDWAKRNLMLANRGSPVGGNSIWNVSSCHVLDCKVHCVFSESSSSSSSKKNHFGLHEIFTSLPSLASSENYGSLRMEPADNYHGSGIWDVAEDVLINILSALSPSDLVRVACTCRCLRLLVVCVMPYMKLKLFPHQRAAVEWMLERELNDRFLPHPLFMHFSTEDGFTFYLNTVSGEIVVEKVPSVRDFCGGMFCDEPGLGKTITALSLILKTQGKLADPPNGVQITWFRHHDDQRCGYYELNGDDLSMSTPPGKRHVSQSARRGQLSLDEFTPVNNVCHSSLKRRRFSETGSGEPLVSKGMQSAEAPTTSGILGQSSRCTISMTSAKKNLLLAYDEPLGACSKRIVDNSKKRKRGSSSSFGTGVKNAAHPQMSNETWVQCDSCRKWRKLSAAMNDVGAAWFCSMNTDTTHQSCKDPEESWDKSESVTDMLGFHSKGTSGANEQNTSFFINVLKKYRSAMNAKTKKALTWLAKLPADRLSLMETVGLVSPVLESGSVSGDGYALAFHKIFQEFGFVKRIVKNVTRWYYPPNLDSLIFDLDALRLALCAPLDSVRLYLSRASLIIVPANLVDHWKSQIQKHVAPGQLRLCIWTDHKRPPAHILAWDYDVVITTFSRLSAEWGPNKQSPLMQVHWLRIMLDEGHTLGSCLNLTNKLQMAISLTASSRWLLTGTPTPNTPNSQLSHLQPMLKFLHEEVYGQNHKSWEAGILRPFEAEQEEGRLRLLELLRRCLISARKKDLRIIPPCIKKVVFVDFNEEHARNYNELVVTVRRNILMADWNDPSHIESLLNPRQRKFRTATVRNVRLSCCVAGHIKVSEVGEDIQETMDVLAGEGLDPISAEYALVKYYLQYGGNCLRCKEWCRLPIITPCRHLLCVDCVALDSERCTSPGCSRLYEMQTPLTRPENPNPKWPVPKDLIELQPSYKQDDWHPDWESTSSSKVAYLVARLKALQEDNKASWHRIYKNNGSVNVERQQGDPLLISGSTGEEGCNSAAAYRIVQDKVIIFSQFLEHIHVIERQLTLAGIKFAGLYSPMHSQNKVKSLATFQNDMECVALLMDGSAALGLDLSFVSHVFLMEPIWDRSMEEQVISRAHRMGATRPIHVETLAMRSTIEEQMVEFLQGANGGGNNLKEEYEGAEQEGVPRTHGSLHDFAECNYLARLSFVRTADSAKA